MRQIKAMKRKIGHSWGVGVMHDPSGTDIPRGWGGLIGRTIVEGVGGGVCIFSGITQLGNKLLRKWQKITLCCCSNSLSSEAYRVRPLLPKDGSDLEDFNARIYIPNWIGLHVREIAKKEIAKNSGEVLKKGQHLKQTNTLKFKTRNK